MASMVNDTQLALPHSTENAVNTTQPLRHAMRSYETIIKNGIPYIVKILGYYLVKEEAEDNFQNATSRVEVWVVIKKNIKSCRLPKLIYIVRRLLKVLWICMREICVV